MHVNASRRVEVKAVPQMAQFFTQMPNSATYWRAARSARAYSLSGSMPASHRAWTATSVSMGRRNMGPDS